MTKCFWMFILACGVLIPRTPISSGQAKVNRAVKDQVLTSSAMPVVRLEFDRAFKYAGSQAFVLYEVANAEQHFFIDADSQNRISRLYWIQFEGYLPTNTHSYNYKVNKMVKIGGLDFIADAYARKIRAGEGRPDSDSNRARAFLESKGYQMASDEVLMQRLVYMVDEAKRNELMIIYLEDLRPSGLTAADLEPGGRGAGRWLEISAELLERAQKGMKVIR